MTNACQTRVRACVWLMLIGCGSTADAPPIDARPGPAPNPNPNPNPGGSGGSSSQWCYMIDVRVECAAGEVKGSARMWGYVDPHKFCDATSTVSTACAAGCAVENAIAARGFTPASGMLQYMSYPAALCADTAEAKVGDACSTQFPVRGCIPTRAKLAADGTVIGHDYLACDQSSKTCVASARSPFAAVACDAATLAQYGTANANGVVALDPLDVTSQADRRACLLAWNTATQTITSSMSISCIGDWQCAAGALCDDQIAMIGTERIAVCKPGPRGTLTPAMLAP